MDTKEFIDENIKEKLLYRETKNGLKIYFMPKKGYVRKHAIFTTDYGSIDNIFVPIDDENPIEMPEGIAHFLEHKLFEESEIDLFEEFADLGASVNAFTNFNQTSYLFETIDNFYRALELLIKFVQNLYLNDETVEREKGIIEEEIKMYEDNPGWKVYFNLLNAMYINNPVKIDIGGTIESVRSINKELLYKAYNTFYHPSNMVLFITGDLDFEKIIKVVENSEKTIDSEIKNIKRVESIEPDEIKENIVEENMYTSNPIFYIGFKDNNIGEKGETKLRKDTIVDIILDMLFGTSSKFYNEFYEKGLINSSFGAYYTSKKDYGHSLIFGESDNPKIVYENIIKLIKEEPEKILKEEDFNRIKQKHIGEFLLSLNSVSSIGNIFTDLYLDDFLITDYFNLIKEIKYKDILKEFKEDFRYQNTVLSIINPLNI